MNKNTCVRRRGAALLLALAAGSGLAARALAETPTAGVVISIEGKPEAKRAEGKSFYPLKVDGILNEGDTVKTGHGARVGIAFVGGAELRINEDSIFKVEKGGGSEPTSVFTQLGNAWTRLMSGNARIQVRTPTAVAAVRGTEADILYVPGGDMTTKVYEGHVDVMNGKGTTELHAGQQTSVALGGQPLPPKKMTPQDYRTWQTSLKPVDLQKSLKLLNDTAVRKRSLNLQMKDKNGKSKSIRLDFEKK